MAGSNGVVTCWVSERGLLSSSHHSFVSPFFQTNFLFIMSWLLSTYQPTLLCNFWSPLQDHLTFPLCSAPFSFPFWGTLHLKLSWFASGVSWQHVPFNLCKILAEVVSKNFFFLSLQLVFLARDIKEGREMGSLPSWQCLEPHKQQETEVRNRIRGETVSSEGWGRMLLKLQLGLLFLWCSWVEGNQTLPLLEGIWAGHCALFSPSFADIWVPFSQNRNVLSACQWHNACRCSSDNLHTFNDCCWVGIFLGGGGDGWGGKYSR